MTLQPLNNTHIIELMSWFNDQHDITQWAGPYFRYPFTAQTFIEDLNLDVSTSFVLVGQQNVLLAFGQYYQQKNKCHLARLIVNPIRRGEGIAASLIKALCKHGQLNLNVNDCSLFIYKYNRAAVSAYKKLGFKVAANTPENHDLSPLPENCVHMVK
ncbi:GNAT family N-acetyltransferase [Pseudoalteromonas sp. SD03]|jgi:ribosomal protein S18 acetylase RimI-like enzyme|uniref:GNAT family N-acetyltransferase n=1 Tax=Pseudoalteromonas sp. SD03 TaxID=3231719 RepID=A0AB39AL84_9GAMM|nr:GNAT family N-acetyltransferase [Pseudoalteromonas sp. APC 3250]MDN3411101.1 GNAT family N-acetyltransferase [Pseudoalteromonas sp. APC 3250]